MSATVDRNSVRGLLLHLLAQVPDNAPSLRDTPIQGAPLLAIGGELVPAASGASFPVLNPATGEIIGAAADADLEDVDRTLASARKAFDTSPWSRDHTLRARCLQLTQAASSECVVAGPRRGVEGLARTRERTIDVSQIGVGGVADDFARCRVQHRERSSGCRRDQLAADREERCALNRRVPQ